MLYRYCVYNVCNTTGRGTLTRDAAYSGADSLAFVSPAVAYSTIDSNNSSTDSSQQQQLAHSLWTVSSVSSSADSYATAADTPVYIRFTGIDSLSRELIAVVTQLPTSGRLAIAEYHDVWLEVNAVSLFYHMRVSPHVLTLACQPHRTFHTCT
jgi:hypothetical protein